MIIANSALHTWLAIYHLISNSCGIIVKYVYSTNKEPYILYYTVIKHQGLLRFTRNVENTSPQTSVFSIFSSVLKCPECFITVYNTWLKLLHLLYDKEDLTIKNAFSMFIHKATWRHGMPYNKSFIDQASMVKIPGYWPHSLWLCYYGPPLHLGPWKCKTRTWLLNIQPSWPCYIYLCVIYLSL